jgi:hypothetical protein
MTPEPSDGKIRIRCPQCGKRLKYTPDQAGKLFACPTCLAAVTTPLGRPPGLLGGSQGGEAAAAQGPAAAPASASAKPAKLGGWQPTRLAVSRNRGIEKLSSFLSRESQRVEKACQDVIIGEPPDVSAALLGERFVRLRVERGQRLQQFIRALYADMDEEIRKLESDPLAHQPRVQEQIARARRERRDLDIFIRVMLRGEGPPE